MTFGVGFMIFYIYLASWIQLVCLGISDFMEDDFLYLPSIKPELMTKLAEAKKNIDFGFALSDLFLFFQV